MHDKKRYYITTSNFKKLVAHSAIAMDKRSQMGRIASYSAARPHGTDF